MSCCVFLQSLNVTLIYFITAYFSLYHIQAKSCLLIFRSVRSYFVSLLFWDMSTVSCKYCSCIVFKQLFPPDISLAILFENILRSIVLFLIFKPFQCSYCFFIFSWRGSYFFILLLSQTSLVSPAHETDQHLSIRSSLLWCCGVHSGSRLASVLRDSTHYNVSERKQADMD